MIPKIKLMDDPMVVELLNKRVGAAQAQAHKDATRLYKNLVRAAKETISAEGSGLDKKTARALSASVVEAMHAEAPVAPAAAE